MAKDNDLVDEVKLRTAALELAIQSYHAVSHFVPSDIVNCAQEFYEFLSEGTTEVEVSVELEDEERGTRQ